MPVFSSGSLKLGFFPMTTSDVIACAAAFIALCALFTTYWQARLAKTHNRLIVRPLLVWHSHKDTSDAGTEVTFKLRNCGVGPALVKDRYFCLNGERFQIGKQSDIQILDLANLALGQSCEYKLRAHGLPGNNSAIQTGSELIIAKILFCNADSAKVDTILAQVGKVEFRVEYESLYNEPLVFSTNRPA